MSITPERFIKTTNGWIAVSRIIRFQVTDSPGWHDNGKVRVWLAGGNPLGLDTGMWERDFLAALEATP